MIRRVPLYPSILKTRSGS